jgi:hypothetical protein
MFYSAILAITRRPTKGGKHFVLARAVGDAFVHGHVPEAVLVKFWWRGLDAV